MLVLIGRLRPLRMPILASYDAMAWIVGFIGMAQLQQLANPGAIHGIRNAAIVGTCCAIAHVAVGSTVRLHQGRAILGSFDDALLLTIVIGVVGGFALILNVVEGPFYTGTVAVSAPMAALLIMFWPRASYRMLREQSERSDWGDVGAPHEPAVIIGAGEGARQLLASMLRDPTGRWRPVALVDDDPFKRHRRLRGLAVAGKTREFPEVAAKMNAHTAIMAIPSAPGELVRELTTLALEAGLNLKVLPSQNDLLNPKRVAISDVRDIEVTDLLGRHVIDTDVASIAGYLTGKRVMVTGAGGSIGSELCRQIIKFQPAELIMFDRDESALHAVQLSMYGRAMLDSNDTVLGDIRDERFMASLFATRRPEVVFHAAALKHLPLLESAPGEAVKTNVWGTLTILEAAAKAGVERFVNISTDKAANPCSVLGYSKRLAEGLTAAVAKEADGTFLSVRFGNVLGSRGSVLTAFAAQIAMGGPVTVTDPGVTRYFMTIREAVQLVIQAGAIGNNGEALVLDMGDAISIESVAQQLIELSGKDIQIVHTGLRPGEKMHEELLGDGEIDERPHHPLITHAPVPAYDARDARALDAWAEPRTITDSLAVACLVLQVPTEAIQ